MNPDAARKLLDQQRFREQHPLSEQERAAIIAQIEASGAIVAEPAPVSIAEVERALRAVRPSAYRLDLAEDGPRLELVLEVSVSGRRNAADRIVRLLGTAGLGLAAADPVEELTLSRAGFPVVRLSR